MNVRSIALWTVAAVSGALLVVSVAGDVRDLTRHAVSIERDVHKSGLRHVHATRLADLGLTRDMDPREINRRLSEAVAHAGTEHRAFDAAQAYGFAENHLIWLATRAELLATTAIGSTADLRFAHVERFDADRILQLGVGLCGQVAILAEIALGTLGYEARAVGIDGHVVVEARFDDGFWILDPDYGVAFPGSLRDAEQNPDMVRAAYAARGYDAERAQLLADLFGPEGNQTDGRYIGDTRWLVRLAEILEHVLPALALAAALGLALAPRRSVLRARSA